MALLGWSKIRNLREANIHAIREDMMAIGLKGGYFESDKLKREDSLRRCLFGEKLKERTSIGLIES